MRFTPFGCVLFDFLSGGVRGPLSIAHVFVISVFRSFDGLPCCDKTTSSKSWPSSRVHQSGCSLHWQFAGFQLLQCGACFFGFRLRSAFSVTFWLELAKERTRINLCPFTLDNSNLASKIRRLRRLFLNVKIPPTLPIALGTWERIIGQVSCGMSKQVCCGSRAVHGEAAGYNISPAGHLDMFARGPESEFRHFSVFHMV